MRQSAPRSSSAAPQAQRSGRVATSMPPAASGDGHAARISPAPCVSASMPRGSTPGTPGPKCTGASNPIEPRGRARRRLPASVRRWVPRCVATSRSLRRSTRRQRERRRACGGRARRAVAAHASAPRARVSPPMRGRRWARTARMRRWSSARDRRRQRPRRAIFPLVAAWSGRAARPATPAGSAV